MPVVNNFFSKVFSSFLREETQCSLAAKTATSFVYGVAGVAVLGSFGIDTSPVIAAFGVGGAAAAFAFKDIGSNFFSGISLAVDNKVRRGDEVVINEKYRGEVLDLNLRNIYLRTQEGNLMQIPNSVVAANPLVIVGGVSRVKDTAQMKGATRSSSFVVPRKIVPSFFGAVTRWTSPDPNDAVPFARDDWAAGRSLEEEERRCGMVASVSSSLLSYSKRQHRLSASSAPRALPIAKRYHAVVKCTPEDWQVNELDSMGDVVFLLNRPKGRWRKVRHNREVLVEADSKEDWTDPKKRYETKFADAGAYVPLTGGSPPPTTPVLGFTMYREATPLADVYRRVQRKTSLTHPYYSMSFSGPERHVSETSLGIDNCGCVTQLGRVIGLNSVQLPHASQHYGMRSLLFWPQRYESLQNGLFCEPATSGNLYRCLLRCCSLHDSAEVQAVTSALALNGFLNYFPLNVFTAHSASRHEVAAAAGSGDFLGACAMHLLNYAESNTAYYESYIKYLSADNSTSPALLEAFARAIGNRQGRKTFSDFVFQLAHLSANDAPQDTLEDVWRSYVSEKGVYYHSALAFVWNAICSQRAISLPVVGHAAVGDVVHITKAEREGVHAGESGWAPARVEGVFSPPQTEYFVKVVESPKEGNKYEMNRVVLPLPGFKQEGVLYPENVISKSLYKEFCSMHNLDWLFSPSNDAFLFPATHLIPTYRTVVAYPEDLTISPMVDPNSYTLIKSDLFMLQERKNLVTDIHAEGRIRTPSVYNMSPQLRVELDPVIEEHSVRRQGKWSVALTCNLPRGSHISTMLRENFDLFHGKFHDLLIV